MAYCGERNKQTIYYANSDGRSEEVMLTDDSGNYTGEWKITYGNPIEVRINVSEAKSRMDRLGSSTYIDPYGLELGYNKVLATSDMSIGITDGSVLWIDTLPELEEDGSTLTPYDYIVVQIKRSLNNILIAVKKVDVSALPDGI